MIRKQYFNVAGGKGRIIPMDLTFDDAVKNAPLVIFAHGFKGFKDWGANNLVAKYFAENGFRYLKFNFSHNGTTVDNPTEFTDLIAFADNTFSMELLDMKNVIDFVWGGSAMPSVKGVYLIGHSRGGGDSIIKTVEDRRVLKLVTMASINDFRALWPAQIEEQWRLQGMTYFLNTRTGQQMPAKIGLLDDLLKHPARLDIMEHAAHVKRPWLIVHGGADPHVPVACAEKLKAANPNAELCIIPGADHTFGAVHPYADDALPPHLLEYCRKVTEFLHK